MGRIVNIPPDLFDRYVSYCRQQLRGRKRARTTSEVAIHLGFRDRGTSASEYRIIRAMTDMANAQGVPICADDAGIYLAESLDEARECISVLRSKAQRMTAKADAIEAAFQ